MIGQTISHYRILGKLGAGGMGVVYKAEDLKLRRTVALKFLPPGMVSDAEARARFVHEAQAAAALNHPNIATIHEIHEAAGHTFIVMEYVEGQSLKDRLASGSLPVREVLTIASHIAAGLEKAHSRGIVHRDIKPANILFTADGMAKIADFGLAKLDEQTRLTQTGARVGTVAYMSPEQVRGGAADQRADLWSLGAVLYEMVTGRLPFRGETEPAVVHSILNVIPEPVTSLNPKASVQLEGLLDKALAKHPERRYQSAHEMLSALVEQRELLKSGLATRRFLVLRRFRRNRRVFYGALTGFVVALLTTAVLVFHGQSLAIDSIAVLPFEDLTKAADQEFIADGMTRELTATFGQISGWSKVISNRTMRMYQGTDKSPREIASEVNVKAVLSGSVQRLANGYIQTIVELVDGDTGKLLWTDTYECALHELKNLQTKVTHAITALVDIELTSMEKERLASATPVDPEAYVLYLRARYQFTKWKTEAFEKAEEYLQRAIAIDPDYAEAYAMLADCYVYFGWIGHVALEEASSRATAFARQSLAIDDALSEAHYALAQIRFYLDWDWAGAEVEYKRAIELNPRNSEAHGEYAWNLLARGYFEEAIAEIKLCLQLDPISYPPNMSLVWLYYCARQYQKAIAQHRQMVELEPNNPNIYGDIVMVYEQMGRYDEAIKARQKRMDLVGVSSEEMEALSDAYRKSGPKGYWMWCLERQKGRFELHPAYIGMYYAHLGDKDQAFAWLDKAYEKHDSPMFRLRVEPGWDPLRDDPRFQSLLQRMNLAGE